MKWLTDERKYYAFRALNKRFVVPVWVLIMIDSGLTTPQIAVIAAVGGIVSFLLEVPSGSIADTIGHKRALILSTFGQGVSLLFLLGGTFWWIMLGSLLYWGIGTLMTGTHEALFFEQLQEKKREGEFRKLMGRARSIADIWSMVTIIFAGVVYAWSPVAAFGLGTILFWVGTIVVATMYQPRKSVSVEKQEGHSAFTQHFFDAMSTIRKSKKLFWIMLTNALVMGAVLSATEFHQVIFQHIGLAAALFGVFYAIKRLFSSVLAPFMHQLFKRVKPPTVLLIMVVSQILFFFFAGTVTNHFLMALVILLPAFSYLIDNIVISDLKNQLIPNGSRATTLSMGNMIVNVVNIAFIFAFGAIATVAPIDQTHIVLGACLLIASLVIFPMTYRAFREKS